MGNTLIHPVISEAMEAITTATTGQKNTIGAITQGINNKRWRQRTGTGQADHCNLCLHQLAHLNSVVATINQHLGLSCQLGKCLAGCGMQILNILVRHIDPGPHFIGVTKGRGRRAGAGTDATTNTFALFNDGNGQVLIASFGFRPRSRFQSDGLIGTVHDTQVTAAAIIGIDHGYRFTALWWHPGYKHQ